MLKGLGHVHNEITSSIFKNRSLPDFWAPLLQYFIGSVLICFMTMSLCYKMGANLHSMEHPAQISPHWQTLFLTGTEMKTLCSHFCATGGRLPLSLSAFWDMYFPIGCWGWSFTAIFSRGHKYVELGKLID